jgi:hypothetical protein
VIRPIVVAAVALLAAVSCGSDAAESPPSDSDDAPVEDSSEQLFPDVLSVELTDAGDRIFTLAVTLSSPYDSPERYADAWRVLSPDGTVLGVRELLHDHANEQPFTRTLSGVSIPADVDEVTVQGRDQVSGWGGATVTVGVASS